MKMLTAYSSTRKKFTLFVPFLSLHCMIRLVNKCIFLALEPMKIITESLVSC